MSLFKKWFKLIKSLFKNNDETNQTTTQNVGAKKLAVCIGINDYPGTNNDLKGCVNDAKDWSKFLSMEGFGTKIYLDSQATKNNVINALEKLVAVAKEGDELVITYSGHGSNVRDTSGDEEDGRDETWYLYDGHLLDDKIREIFSKLPKGVKLTILSDSCHSGTVTRAMLSTMEMSRGKPRYMPPEDDIEAISIASLPLKRSMAYPEEGMNHVLISGCKSTEYSYDATIGGRPCGAFSYYALAVLRKNPKATYNEFYQKLKTYLPSTNYPQSPQLEGSEENKNKPMFG